MQVRSDDDDHAHGYHDLHWLDVNDRIKFPLCFTVYKCVHGMAFGYLSELCQPVSARRVRRHLCSAGHGHLAFPCVRRAYTGPSAWNSLPDDLRDTSFSLSVLGSKLNSHLFTDY